PQGGNVISGNGNGVLLLTGATGNGVAGNFIGTNMGGTVAIPNGNGIYISGAPANTIGGISSDARNVISGNSSFGIAIRNSDGSTGGNDILGNFIGTAASGSTPLPNGADGISIDNVPNTTIGRSTPIPGTAGGNLISGNNANGVQITGPGGVGTLIQGHLIGLNIVGFGV